MLYLKFVTTAKKGASQMPHTGGGTFLSFNREISLWNVGKRNVEFHFWKPLVQQYLDYIILNLKPIVLSFFNNKFCCYHCIWWKRCHYNVLECIARKRALVV